MNFEKKIINGRVGVIYDPYSLWSFDETDEIKQFLMYDSIIIDYIMEDPAFPMSADICEKIYNRLISYNIIKRYGYLNTLCIEWIPVGTNFAISRWDNDLGCEEIFTLNAFTT